MFIVLEMAFDSMWHEDLHAQFYSRQFKNSFYLFALLNFNNIADMAPVQNNAFWVAD